MRLEIRIEGNAPVGMWRMIENCFPSREISEDVYFNPVSVYNNFQLAQRMISAFYAMHEYEQSMIDPVDRPHSGVWQMMKHEFHGKFYELIERRDAADFAWYMNNAMRETVTHGLGPGKATFEAIQSTEQGMADNTIIIIDRLASLAQALGALQVEGNEQGPYGVACEMSAQELTDLIEAAIKAPIGRPPAMGFFGVSVQSGIIDTKVPEDVYTIHRIKQILDANGLSGVCEIGGGLGGNAIQALRMGLPSYTIADLPITNIVQGWYVASVAGPDKVRMFGEPDAGQPIQLLPYWQFFDRGRDFGLVINRDSMPEIQVEHAKGYVKEIADRGSHFLSINQEGRGPTSTVETRQLLVRELVAAEGRQVCISRTPAWVRQGYVEELFVPKR